MELLAAELSDCADMSAELDSRMENIRKRIEASEKAESLVK